MPEITTPSVASDVADVLRPYLSSGTSAVPRLGVLRVASSQAPAVVKEQCNYVCTGTNDQTQINQALLAASRPGDGFGGIGAGLVELVGGDFFTSHNDATAITMYPSTWLRGTSTLIQPRWPTDQDRGWIELLNSNVDKAKVSDLTLGRPDQIASNGHGIKYSQVAASSPYELGTGNDPFLKIQDVTILKPRGKGVYLTGTSGGCRASQLVDLLVWDSFGDAYDLTSSDVHVDNCNGQTGGTGVIFRIAGGNAKCDNSKGYYSETDCWVVSSSRAELNGCAAQDNGRWGLYLTGQDATVTGFVADSNQRLDQSGGGAYIGSRGMFEITAYDRGQTPGSPQTRAIVLGGSPQVFLTGRTSVPSGGAHITGTPNANSYVRVVRDGTTPYTVG